MRIRRRDHEGSFGEFRAGHARKTPMKSEVNPWNSALTLGSYKRQLFLSTYRFSYFHRGNDTNNTRCMPGCVRV